MQRPNLLGWASRDGATPEEDYLGKKFGRRTLWRARISYPLFKRQRAGDEPRHLAS